MTIFKQVVHVVFSFLLCCCVALPAPLHITEMFFILLSILLLLNNNYCLDTAQQCLYSISVCTWIGLRFVCQYWLCVLN